MKTKMSGKIEKWLTMIPQKIAYRGRFDRQYPSLNYAGVVQERSIHEGCWDCWWKMQFHCLSRRDCPEVVPRQTSDIPLQPRILLSQEIINQFLRFPPAPTNLNCLYLSGQSFWPKDERQQGQLTRGLWHDDEQSIVQTTLDLVELEGLLNRLL